MIKKRKPILDGDGNEVTAGCVVSFSYGIPAVGVRANVVERNGKLFALTPGHKPTSCLVSKLYGYVGDFYVVGSST